MSKKTTKPVRSGTKAAFQVKPVYARFIAARALEELSQTYGDVCNYLEAAALARAGDLFLALTAVEQHNKRVTVVTPREHWVTTQAVAVLKKLVDPNYDRWAETRQNWFSTENRCRRMNQKFMAFWNRRVQGKKVIPPELSHWCYRFYEGIHYVLGDAPPLEDIAAMAHYGPGSTVQVRGAEVHYARKLEANECVRAAVDLASLALSHDKAVWAHLGMDPTYVGSDSAREGFIRVAREMLLANVVSCDRLMFIHKSMTSHRSIGAQPTCSGMLQLGVHSVVSDLLKRVKIDLSDQGRNRKLAAQGSRRWREDDPICTLDKSNASNTLARQLVRLFFPKAWGSLLLDIRTPNYEAPEELGGGEHVYHMYAGMGNGTTFCVETLVFWAATYATSDAASIEEYVERGTYAVYGDDVILRRNHALRYMRFAKWLGFKFNMSKTFTEGPFRESCGADYFDGVDVRPASLSTETGRLEMSDLIGFHNTLADQPNFGLPLTCQYIRDTWQQRVFPVLPTDNQGNLGFRPIDCGGYDTVRDRRTGLPVISEVWRRPRYFILDVKPQWSDLGELDPWTQYAVALLRSRQSKDGSWGLPFRGLTTTKVVAERDMERKDLVVMLRNQLSRLAVYKAQPWWDITRGQEKKG